MAVSCLPQAGYAVRLESWERFSERLLGGSSPASTAGELKREGYDCILGGIDLSLRCVDSPTAVYF